MRTSPRTLARCAPASLALAIALLLHGCIRTFHPIYTDKSIVQDDTIVGEWGKPGSEERWIFARDKDSRYRLTVLDDERRKGEFVATLTSIGERKFLDLFPAETDDETNAFLKFHSIPHHTFFWVKATAPTLQLAAPNPERIEQILASDPAAIPHIKRDRADLVLTGTTDQLRAFLLEKLATPDAFTEPSDLQRTHFEK